VPQNTLTNAAYCESVCGKHAVAPASREAHGPFDAFAASTYDLHALAIASLLHVVKSLPDVHAPHAYATQSSSAL
jgi:hypothetical protein